MTPDETRIIEICRSNIELLKRRLERPEWKGHEHDLHKEITENEAIIFKLTEEEKGDKSEHPCKKCGALTVYVKEINDYPDYRITCYSCNHSYCVDGPDG